MPHVVTQMGSEGQSREALTRREAVVISKHSREFKTPAPPPMRQTRKPGAKPLPSLSLLAMPENNRWDFGSIRHIHQPSNEFTPDSTTDSVFEIPSGGARDTPNSSTHSLFIAELEDTSPMVMSKAPTTWERLTTMVADVEHSSRAAVAIENITAIEADNRQLLERAVAAEMAAKALRDQNVTLQRRIDRCSQQHRPKTAPSQNPPSFALKSRRTVSATAPISSFNESPPVPSTALKQSPRVPPKPFSASSRDLAYRSFASVEPPPSPTHRPVRRPPPLKLNASHTKNTASAISGPLPGSVAHHQVTFKGTPLSFGPPVATISLADAQRRQKPLPCINLMSPSVVHGFVEMGNWVDTSKEEQERYKEKEGELRKKKTFGDLFRWAKKS